MLESGPPVNVKCVGLLLSLSLCCSLLLLLSLLVSGMISSSSSKLTRGVLSGLSNCSWRVPFLRAVSRFDDHSLTRSSSENDIPWGLAVRALA